jgi:hypothetical protein
VTSQTPTTQIADAPKRNLAEFEGHYEYRDGLTLFMVTSGEQLIVVSTGSAFFVDSPMNDMMARVLLPALMRSSQKKQLSVFVSLFRPSSDGSLN